MAGDWIKFEHATSDKPEVVKMATVLKINQDAVVGKLLRVWVWADLNSIGGETVGVTEAFIDRMTCKRGFAAAMRSVDWLAGEDGGLRFTNFSRHNGATAKARAVDNRKKAAQRERDKTPPTCPHYVPVPSGQTGDNNRDQRREEKSITNPAPTAEPAGRKRDMLFDALAIAEGSDPKQLTAPAAKKIGVALASIRKVAPDLAPSDIQARARAYRRLYPTAAITAHALAAHWAKCGGQPERRAAPPLPEPSGWKAFINHEMPDCRYAAGSSHAQAQEAHEWTDIDRESQQAIIAEMRTRGDL